MLYCSTRNKKKTFSFEEVFLNALASDGGLYIPANIPVFSEKKIQSMKKFTFQEISYEIFKVFVGDTLFMPDGGTARADIPGGSAEQLYKSIQKIFTLPDKTRLFVCHDYMPNERDPAWETTVLEQKKNNIHIGKRVSEEKFVQLRTERDKTLPAPELMIPSIQVNMRAGNLPPQENNGTTYLKVPIKNIKDRDS